MTAVARVGAGIATRVAQPAVMTRPSTSSTGVVTTWANEPQAVLGFAALGREVPSGEVVIHHELTVELTGAVETTVIVPWWVDSDGVHHVMRTWTLPQGM